MIPAQSAIYINCRTKKFKKSAAVITICPSLQLNLSTCDAGSSVPCGRRQAVSAFAKIVLVGMHHDRPAHNRELPRPMFRLQALTDTSTGHNTFRLTI